jgi:methyl-accepting chemotaxis protein
MSNTTESPTPKRGNRPPLHKRQYIVDRPFQHRLIGTLMAIWLANSLFFSIVLYFLYAWNLKRFYEITPIPGMLPLLSLPALLGFAIAFVMVFGLVVLAIIAIYLSNQIAGPLFRTKRCMDRVARGDFGFSLVFRRGDFLQDLPGVFNAMLDGLREKLEADVEDLEAIDASASNPGEVRRLVRKVLERKQAQLGGPAPERERTVAREIVSLAVH